MSYSAKLERHDQQGGAGAEIASSEAFLVRVWREPQGKGRKGSLRLSVRQLGTGEVRYLADLSDLDGFLQARLEGKEGIRLAARSSTGGT